MILVSACLLGVNCRFDAENNRDERVVDFLKKTSENVIPICPEQLGGLPTPRNPSIVPKGGKKVVEGQGEVIMKGFGNVTRKFVKGAEEVLKLAEDYDGDKAILKEGSPSCGKTLVWKEFQEKSEGTGVTTAMLEKNGIDVISETDL